MVTSSIEKTIAVLRALADHGPEPALADIARETALPKATVHRVLHELAGLGLVATDGSGRYFAGGGLLALAGQFMSQRQIGRYGRASLLALRDLTGFTVHLAVRSGDRAIYVDKLEPAQPYQLASHVGMTIPLHSTSIGRAILAAVPPPEAEALLRSIPLNRLTDRTLTSVPALLDDLAVVRARGYAIDDGENEDGVRCIGAAVFDSMDEVVGAVSTSTLIFSLPDGSVEEVGTLVREAANDISAALGASRTT